jgi:hypothetical protein
LDAVLTVPYTMKAVPLLVLLILGKASWAQTAVQYRYLSNDRVGVVSPKVFLHSMAVEFRTQRTYHGPAMFSETRLFTGNAERALRFLLKENVWYYRVQGRWRLFYDYAHRSGGVLDHQRITFVKAVQVRGMALHKLVLEQPGFTSSHRAYYYFSPKKGVLLIGTSTGVLVRSDFLKTPLSEEEVDAL